jgi:dCTP deaminase
MPRLITGERLKQAVEGGTFIINGDPSGVEAVKYDFHMGSSVLKALYGQPKDIDKIPEEERWVDPGEAVFLLTREKLDLPANMIAILTPKRKLAHSGIMMLGGLAVDPCYKGHLLLGLYNFSSTKYPLRPGAKLIAAVFYELDGPEVCDVGAPPEL